MATNNKDDLARNKEMVLAAIKSINRGDKASQIVYTSKFKGFCKTDTMDAFLHACDDYFTIFFEVRTIEEEESAKNSAETLPRKTGKNRPEPKKSARSRSRGVSDCM